MLSPVAQKRVRLCIDFCFLIFIVQKITTIFSGSKKELDRVYVIVFFSLYTDHNIFSSKGFRSSMNYYYYFNIHYTEDHSIFSSDPKWRKIEY